MKAKVELGGILVSLPIEYLEQQTCRESCFSCVPDDMIDVEALITANGENNDITWYRCGVNKAFFKVSIPTELITWEE